MSTAIMSNGTSRYSIPTSTSLLRDIFGLDPFAEVGSRTNKVAAFVPRLDVIEHPDAYVLTADLPGVQESDLDISLDSDVLTIAGQRKPEKEHAGGETYHLYECRYGKFRRSFALPAHADSDAIDAALRDGVLRLVIGKKTAPEPRKIALNTSY